MQRRTRFLVWLLSAVMLLSCVPHALAEEEIIVLDETPELEAYVEELIDETPAISESVEEMVEEVVEEASDTETVEEVLADEDVTFVEDVSTAADCTHPETTKKQVMLTTKSESLDDEYHLSTGKLVERTVCSVCGATLNEVVLNENYQSERKHTLKVTKGVIPDSYAPFDETYHLVIGPYVEQTTCSVCKYKKTVTIQEQYEGKAKHTFDDSGVCTKCGYSNVPLEPLTMGEVTMTISADNKSAFIDKPVITGGTGSYQIAYNIYDDQGNAVNYFYQPEDNNPQVAATPGANGRYIVYVVVSDGQTKIQKDTGWFELNGYAPLEMSELVYEIAEDKHIYINKPVVTGGTGTYQIAYNIYDDQGNAVNYFYQPEDSNPRVAASPMKNGIFNVFVVVRDGVSEVQDNIGWHELTGY